MDKIRHIGDSDGIVWSGAGLVGTLADRAGFFLFSYSPTLRSLLSWSSNAEGVLGVKDASIAREGNLFLRHVHPDDRFLLLTELEKALKGEAAYRATYRWVRPDNKEVRWLHCRASLTEQGGESLFEGVIIDLSAELTGSIGKLAGPDSISTILAAFPIMVFTLDRDLRLMRINRPSGAHSPTFGDTGFDTSQFKVGHSILDCFSDGHQRTHFQEVMNQILDGLLPSHSARVFQDNTVQSLEIVPISEQGAIEGLLCMMSDISEIVRLERQLADLQKAEGLRLLAAGVAHHFNNCLQSIIGQASVINSHPQDQQLAIQASQSIMETVNKASDLSRQLYVFEDTQRGSLTPIDVNLAVMAAANRIEDLFTSGFKVGVVFGNISRVAARQSELVEAVEAVLRNAKEAMAGRDNGVGSFSIKTYEVQLRDFEVADLKAGAYAKISIFDSGQGMPEETIRRCFDPFFTTKEHDPHTGISLAGSGLGLSKAFTIVREFSGSMTVESQPGLGTTISIYLPIGVPSQAPAQASLIERPQRPDILIIDDDLLVLKTISAMLQDMGYSCVTAEDYSHAVNLTKSYSHSLQLVLLDAVMPGMDGAAVLNKLKKINKDLAVIGFSGASQDQTKPLLEAGALRILRKPVDPQTLKEVVRQTLQAKQAA